MAIYRVLTQLHDADIRFRVYHARNPKSGLHVHANLFSINSTERETNSIQRDTYSIQRDN